ncbi:class I SAM-dependent methyltransferase [Methylobacterium sp. NPDC080182]|uniref:class I SAM-dependent methyltransferase n=1 Tax=Methylobacterium sp. NPDC080182 TaxID=3390590 RepID=UPI003CFDB0E8
MEITPPIVGLHQTGPEPIDRTALRSDASFRRVSTASYYERHAERYADATLPIDTANRIARFATMVPRGGRVLDAGCGSGRDLIGLREAGLKPEGLELSPRLAVIARRNSNVPVHVADICSPGLPLSSFDAVWAMASLLHVERDDIEVALRSLNQLLVPGGLLFATLKSGTGRARDEGGRWFTLYEPRGWSGRLRNAGFSEVSVETERLVGMSPEPATGWIASLARRPA